ncbi:glycoside hydrolase family 48 protein [Streptomyces sp. TRM 70361]|uniref:glycoside hydrolase family 48 protein n=1 Tax=Streptomyces sp. TRM 70361 TaxID=3116553 RepID=UPI003FCC4ADA
MRALPLPEAPPRRHRGRSKRLLIAATAAISLPLGMTTALSGTAQAAALQCSVDYKKNDWGSGFSTSITLTNRGSGAIDDWTLTYEYSGNQKLQQGWNGQWSQSGKTVTVKSPQYSTKIASGEAITAGANFSYSGTNADPTAFSVNGTRCNGALAAPAATLVSPGAGQVYTAGSTVKLTAEARPVQDGATIEKVDFYSDTELLGSDTTAPYSFDWEDVPAGNYSIYAVAHDSNGMSSESAPAGIQVTAGPAVVVTPSQLGVRQGETASFAVKLSKKPTENVTASVRRTDGNSGVSVLSGEALTFTPENWAAPQTVTVSAADTGSGAATFTVSAPGHEAAEVKVTQLGGDAVAGEYEDRFLDLYNKIFDPANGYFSPEGIPYHSVETLIVEAPDHGHETTSEAYSYLIWLQAMYGKVTEDWGPLNESWQVMEDYMIPTAEDQPTNSFYDPSSPATYAAEHPEPSDYPSAINPDIPVGEDPIADELRQAYGTEEIYGMHWLQDVDNTYGYGNAPGATCQGGPDEEGPSYINTFQRGSQESVWETVPQPTCDDYTFGGENGYLDLFIDDDGYAEQWKYTNAPDADARAIQALYWAELWAEEQGKKSEISGLLEKGAKMGDYLRYSFFDKYFKEIGDCVGASSCPAGSGKNSAHYLMSWYYAWGGATDTDAGWAWRIGSSHNHFGYQNPMAAYALTTVPELEPKSATGADDWEESLQRQMEFYRWLQSDEGAIAGGATNSWGGNYGTPPSGTATFYGMFYDEKPVYHDPPSNQWFGMQAWSMQRVAELYHESGNATAKEVLDKWVDWVLGEITVNPDGNYQIPSTLEWSGQPDDWNASNPGDNSGLHVNVRDYTTDIGVTAALARTLMYYSAESGDTEARETAKALIDAMWQHQDDLGLGVEETRTDYERFDDEVYIPSGWSGTMPNGDEIEPGSTFLSIRSFYEDDPQFNKVESYLNGGEAPTFTYHRFWAQADAALAYATYADLFGDE